MMYDDAGWGWWVMGVVPWVVLLLLLLLAGAVAVMLVVSPQPGNAGTVTDPVAQPSVAALEALDVRFARGEVDEDTYRRSREVLSRRPGW